MMAEAIYPAHSFQEGNAIVNVYHADKGQGLPRHAHAYSHVTFCTAGSCYVRKEGKEVFIDKMSQPLNLCASDWHEIEAAEDNTVFINVFHVEQPNQKETI